MTRLFALQGGPWQAGAMFCFRVGMETRCLFAIAPLCRRQEPTLAVPDEPVAT
jgi:hypothetical protein